MIISNISLGIGIPLNFPFVPSPFFDSFIAMEKPSYEYFRENRPSLEDMRNSIVKRALDAGCSHLMMMDTDMCFHPKTITRLLSLNLDVVGALCYKRYPPFDPIMYKGDINTYEIIEEWEEGELVEVDATGTGCLMFNMKVFREMPDDPWFRFRPNPDQNIGGIVGEDIGFCSDLKRAGYKIYVDTSIPAEHLTTLSVGRGTFMLYRAMKKIQTGGK